VTAQDSLGVAFASESTFHAYNRRGPCWSLLYTIGNETMLKKIIGCLAGACALLAFSIAYGKGLPEFNQADFNRLLAQGQPEIVYFHATWCPTCKIQEPIVERLSASPKFKSVTFFNADYDTQVALKKALHVNQQSTFVVFKNGREITRSTGQTSEQAIEATFDKAL